MEGFFPTEGAEPLDPLVEPALAYALADELVALTGQLAELAFELAAHPETLRRHMHSLQAVDRITQVQLAIADLLRSNAPMSEKLAMVTLEDLATTLQQSVASYRQDSTRAA